MSKNEIFNVRNITRLALVAALYAAVTLAIPGLSFSAVQFRFSEILVLLCFYRKDYCVPLILGCFIANLFSPFGLYDIIFGTLATAAAVIPMYYVRNIWLSSLLPVISNGIIVGFELFLCGEPLWFSMGTVALGELVVITVIGCPLFRFALERSKPFMKVIGADKRKYSPKMPAEQQQL